MTKLFTSTWFQQDFQMFLVSKFKLFFLHSQMRFSNTWTNSFDNTLEV